MGLGGSMKERGQGKGQKGETRMLRKNKKLTFLHNVLGSLEITPASCLMYMNSFIFPEY